MSSALVNSRPLRHKILSPLRSFFGDSRSVGLLLICCTLASIIVSNTGSNDWYRHLWSLSIPSGGFLNLPSTPLKWINDFLMAFFFLLAGTEIKRELVNGELSNFKRAVLPFGAAFGGMLIPALIFTLFNLHKASVNGWGIPTATDIAFSIGVASLLGKRIPVGLKIFLMALAIIDDLGAIVVVALFYGGQIQWIYLLIAALIYGLLFMCNYFKLKFGVIQIVLGLLLWYAVLHAGIEASISGVLFAFALPVKQIPQIQKSIHLNVNFVILPLFALANTAILFPGHIMQSLQTTVGMGIIVGLVIGKPVGIFLFSRILVALNIAHLPRNVHWKQMFGMGTLAGIGFTMSIFTTMLAFSDAALQDIAKISILASVILSLIISMVYFWSLGQAPAKAKESSVDEAGLSLNLG